MRWLALLLFAGIGFAQIDQTLDRGSLHATVKTEAADDWGPSLVVAANSDDPTVVSFEITLNFVVDGETYSRNAIAHRTRNKMAWVRQEFYLPYFAKIVSVCILERKDPQVITVDRYMTRESPPFSPR